MLGPMRQALPPSPRHLPVDPGPYRPAMGLIARPLSALTEFAEDYPAQMAERRDLLASRHDAVFGALPGSEAARAETLSVIAAHLATDRAEWFTRDGDMLVNHLTGEAWRLDDPGCDALELAGRLVQEDLCLLAPDDEGALRLVAAVLCFPSRWRLADKLGQRMDAIHGPVPRYAEKLGRPVDRFLGLLKPGRLVERMNWSVHDDPALFQPAGHGATEIDPTITAANAGARLTFRVERQTLSRLPESGAVLFTIRTHQHALAEMVASPEAASILHAAVTALPPDVAAYKSVGPFRESLLAWLAARAGSADGAGRSVGSAALPLSS